MKTARNIMLVLTFCVVTFTGIVGASLYSAHGIDMQHIDREQRRIKWLRAEAAAHRENGNIEIAKGFEAQLRIAEGAN